MLFTASEIVNSRTRTAIIVTSIVASLAIGVETLDATLFLHSLGTDLQLLPQQQEQAQSYSKNVNIHGNSRRENDRNGLYGGSSKNNHTSYLEDGINLITTTAVVVGEPPASSSTRHASTNASDTTTIYRTSTSSKYVLVGPIRRTGYYLPYEGDYIDDQLIDITVNDMIKGKIYQRQFHSGFLAEISLEGAGQTLSKDFIMKDYTIDDHPYISSTSVGFSTLQIGGAATTQDLIGINGYGWKVWFTDLPQTSGYIIPQEIIVIDAYDNSHRGFSFDIFTGIGREGRELTYKVDKEKNAEIVVLKSIYDSWPESFPASNDPTDIVTKPKIIRYLDAPPM